MKPNDTPLYVHKTSNHPPGILRNIPQSVNNRLSSISANEDVFDQAIQPYQEALQKSGYEFQLKFTPRMPNISRKNRRQRKITWFNPPFSKHIQTNIGEIFLKLIDEYFPPNHLLAKILNRNTVKISYKCMPNMGKAISRHNYQILKQEEEQTMPGCNCSGRCGPCPLDGKCLVDKLVYRATVRQDDINTTTNTYTGLTSNTFKERFYGHRSSFEHQNHKNPTTLSTHIWDLKRERRNFEISWSVVDRARDFDPVNKKCRLCLKEKYHIIFQPSGATLNQRSELFSTCRHRLRKTLANT